MAAVQAAVGGGQQSELHPDLKRATSGLMLTAKNLEEATGIKDWNMPRGVPRFGSVLEEKDKMFVKCRGTCIGTMDWSSVGTDGLFVSDVRLVFETERDCLTYYRSSIASHAELVCQDSSGCFPRMVEVDPQGYLVGQEPRMFCGPSLPARQRLILSLTADRSKEEAAHLVRLAEKAVHLLYLFCSGRVMCKVRVTTHNGLTPLGHAHALAVQTKRLVDLWLPSGAGEEGGERKAALRRALQERAQQRKQEEGEREGAGPVPVLPRTPPSQRITPHAVPNKHTAQWTEEVVAEREGARGADLCVFAVGEGEPRGSSPVKRHVARLLESVEAEEARRRGRPGEEGAAVVSAVHADSEEGRAVQSYAAANASQRPAPLVLLCPRLKVLLPPPAAHASEAAAPHQDEEARVRAVQAVGDVLWEWSCDPKVNSALRGKHGPCPAELKAVSQQIRQLAPLRPTSGPRG